MSEREELAKRLEAFIASIPNVHGVEQELRPREDGGTGHARAITFSVGRMESELVIWNPKRLDFLPDAKEEIWLNFTSEEEFKAWAKVYWE